MSTTENTHTHPHPRPAAGAHGHGHGHAHHGHMPVGPEGPGEEIKDPGLAALSEALRIGFLVLKLVIGGVIVLFLWSGMYKLEENEVGIVLRFGAPVRTLDSAGWKWKWPEPVEEVVTVPKPKVQQSMEVDAFWYAQTAQEKAGLAPSRPGETLRLAVEGYTLTASASAARVEGASGGAVAVSVPGADYNLAHTRWRLRYVIADAQKFVETLWPGEATYGESSSTRAVELLLRSAVADAVVVVSAQRDIDAIIWENPLEFKNAVRRRVEARLAALDVGVRLAPDGLELIDKIPPRQVKDAFDRASSANIEAQRLVNEASARASEIVATSRADADNRIARAQGYRRRVIEAARADGNYLTQIVSEVERAADARVGAGDSGIRQGEFDRLLALTVDQLYQETLREVVGNADEAFVLSAPEGAEIEWRPLINRNPAIAPRNEQSQQDMGGNRSSR